MFCINCGNRLPEGARFCSMCGARVVLPEELAEEIKEPAVHAPEQDKPEVIVDEAAVARAEAKATASVPPVSREIPATQPATPVRTRIAFDWSNVKDEPQKKQILNVKSPWDETGGFDEEALYKEMTPSTDRSRTMNFIDVLKAEREQNADENSAVKSKSAEDADISEESSKETSSKQTFGDEPPRLHFAPLYEDFDTPVKTPFDELEKADAAAAHESEHEPAHEPEYREEPEAEQTEEKSQKASSVTKDTRPSWHWFEMPDFLKKNDYADRPAEKPAEQEEEKTEAPDEAPSAAEFRFNTIASALFEEPKYEDIVEPAPAKPEETDPYETESYEPEPDEATLELYAEPEADYSEYEDLYGFAGYEEFVEEPEEEPAEPEDDPEEPEEVVDSEPYTVPAFESEPENVPPVKMIQLTPAEPAVSETEPERLEEDHQDHTEPYTYIYTEAEAEPESETEAEPDYYDYISLDMSRPAADGEIVGRAASHASEDTASVESAGESEPVSEPEYPAEPETSETEDAAENGSAAEPESIVEPGSAAEPEAAQPDEADNLFFDDTPSLENDLADILAAGEYKSHVNEEEESSPESAADTEPAEETEDTPVDENELFAEINESSPKKTGMTIAAPAEQESEIESLKRRLAELTGAPEQNEQPEQAEAEMLTFDGTETAEAVEASEPDTVNADEISPAEPAADDTAETLLSFITPETEAEEAAKSEDAKKEADDTIKAFEDELSKFLADVSEPDDTTPVFGLTPYSEFEEAEAEAAETAEPELITLTGPEPDASAVILEEISEVQPAAEAAVSEAEPVVMPVVEQFEAPLETAEAEAQPQETDALSLEDLETDLFGETPSPDAEAEVTKKIDKFYTLYRKNEEFQRLLDEEYSKLKTESHPAAVESSKPAAAGTAVPPVREVEDVTIYQELTPEEKKALAEAEAAQAAKAEVEAAVAAAAPQPVEIKTPPVEWDKVAAEEKAAGKKETRKEKKERKKREQEEIRAREAAAAAAASEFDYDDTEQGSVFLTVIAVIIAILLVILLAIILVLNFAPDSSIALQINSIIENITSHFSAVDNTGGQYLL